MARVMGTPRDNEFITLPTLWLNMQIKSDMTLFWERFQNCPIFKESQLAIEAFGANYDEISKEDHAYVCTAEEQKRRQNSWVLTLTAKVNTFP